MVPAGTVNTLKGPRVDIIKAINLNRPIPIADGNTGDVITLDAAIDSSFPNGRRVIDDVVTVELRAIAGLTIPLVDKSFTPDDATKVIKDGTTNTNPAFLNRFPYLGTPAGGYQSLPGTPKV